jgi:hypothetical protein
MVPGVVSYEGGLIWGTEPNATQCYRGEALKIVGGLVTEVQIA